LGNRFICFYPPEERVLENRKAISFVEATNVTISTKPAMNMNTFPLVRASAISPVVKFLNHIGAPTQQLLLQSKLPDLVLDDPEGLISLYQASSFLELAAHQEGIELLGILASQPAQIPDLGLYGKILSQSLTGYDLLQTIVGLLTKTYSSGAHVWLTQDDDRVWLNHQYPSLIPLENQQIQYYACSLHLRVMQLIIPGCHPTDLHFEAGKVQGLSQMDVFSTARVRFNQPHNAIGLPKSLLYQPVKQRGKVHQSNLQECYERLQSSAPASNFVESLRQFIRFQLQSGYFHIEVAAEAGGISVRTLQRQLAEAGLSYSDLVDEVRFQLAVDRLKDPTIQLADIAFELGYTRPANFTRAFHRWAGVSPIEFRKLQLLKN
jgi:AraC-like DNA-binding protein